MGKQPKDVTVLPIYLSFLDNFTQLIATDPHKIPPFPRLRLNESIRKLGWIPSEVHVSIAANSLTSQPINATSKHVMIPELSNKDRDRISQAKSYWMHYKSVDLATYRGFKQTMMDRLVRPVSAQLPVKQKQHPPANSTPRANANNFDAQPNPLVPLKEDKATGSEQEKKAGRLMPQTEKQ